MPNDLPGPAVRIGLHSGALLPARVRSLARASAHMRRSERARVRVCVRVSKDRVCAALLLGVRPCCSRFFVCRVCAWECVRVLVGEYCSVRVGEYCPLRRLYMYMRIFVCVRACVRACVRGRVCTRARVSIRVQAL